MTFMKYKSLLTSLLVTLTFASESVLAQEMCSADDVDAALNELSCFADGFYLSPDSIASSIGDLCYNEYSESACRACFRSAKRKLAPALKSFTRLRLIAPNTLADFYDALTYAEDDICYYAGNWTDGADDNERNAKRLRARPKAGARRGTGVEARSLVEDLCPCDSPRWQGANGRSDFLGCAETVTDILVRHGKLDDQRAQDLHGQLQRSNCGK